jgi:hypothetical protein
LGIARPEPPQESAVRPGREDWRIVKRIVLTALAAALLAALSLGVLSVPAGAGVFNTTTSLSVAPSSVTYGQETTAVFTATVTAQDASNPGSGTVTVTAGSTTLCSFDLITSDGGSGSCSPSSDTLLSVAGSPYSVTASYGGSSNNVYSASPDSSPVSLTVNQQATTTSLSFSGSPVVYGQESTLTFDSSVTPTISGTPTGTIAVAAGATPLCTITPPDTSCSTNDDPLSATGGPYAITATYGGDTNFAGSPSSPQDLAVTKASTTTMLTLSPSSVTFGNESTLLVTATVSPEFAVSPSGTITVTAGGIPLCNIVLPATTCSPLDNAVPASDSPYAVSASYSGDDNYGDSLSNPLSLTVTADNTTTTLSIAPTTVAYGNESSVAFTATVSSTQAGSPTGTITVAAGATTLCTIDVATATSCNTTDIALPASGSPYSVVASYSGDENFMPSSDTKNLTVNKATTTTTLVGPFSVVYGNEGSVTFSPTVTAAFSSSPTGLVTVTTANMTLCTFTLPSGTGCAASNTALPASGSPYSVTATFAGDSNFTGSTSSPGQSLTVTKATTTTTLTISSATVTYGNEASLNFTATVSPEFTGTPGGTVTVKAGSTVLCSMTLPTTQCSTTDDPLNASGTQYAIAATYSGDTNFTGSTSSTKNLTVGKASTSTSLNLSQFSVSFGSESTVVFTATITPQFAGSTPTGVVTVATSSATTLCTITLPVTTCSTTDQALAPSGTAYSVTASYPGDTNFTGSTSGAQSLTITGGNSTTTVSPSSSSVIYGNETTVTFTVTVTPLKAGTPTGTATVKTGATTLCTVTTLTPDGSGTCRPSNSTLLTVSSTAYPVVATYSGDSNFSPSASDPSNLTVTQATTGTALAVSPSSVTYGGESAVIFSTVLTPQFSGTPTGSVTVAAGSTFLCTITLPSASSCFTGQTKLGAGVYTITATYSGDNNFGSSPGTNGLTVKQATPSSPSIANLPSGAAEEGSFVASVATSGDGTRSVASQTTGTCTVGGDGVTVSFLVAGTCTLTPLVSNGHNFTGANGSPQTFTIAFGPRGYWLVGSDGGIFSFGNAQFYGSMGGTPLQRPVVGITPTHTKHGYWLVASDGGIFSFGDSNFFGSIPGLGLHPAGSGQPNSLAAPIVGMVPSSTGNGYFMVASDGGVFAFGDARFAGSCPGIGGCAGAAVAVMPDHSGNGYWLVTSAGAIYAFGDAPFFGAPSPQSSPVVNAVATPDGRGYWILYANGAVLNFGDASGYGNPVGFVNQFNPATSIFPTTDGLGYWVASARGDVFTFGNAPFLGSMSSTPLNGPIIAAFGF